MMNRILLAGFFSVVLAIPVLAKSEPKLQIYAPAESKCLILFAEDTDEVRVRDRLIDTKAGQLNLYSHAFAATDSTTFQLTWIDYPSTVNTAETKFQSAILTGMAGKYGTVKTEKTISTTQADHTKLEGKEYLINYTKYSSRNRVFVNGQRLYMITATGNERDLTSKWANRFFESFTISEK
ncbi:MAG: hypothetical protein ACRCZF_08350 [Gemmataceae bacterium]